MRQADHRDYRDLCSVFHDNLISCDLDVDRDELIQECLDNILDVNFDETKTTACFIRACGTAVGSLIANVYETPELANELDGMVNMYIEKFNALVLGD